MSSDVPKYRVIAFAMIVALLSGSFASVLYVGSAIAVLLVKRFNIRLLLIYIAGTLLGGVLLVVIAPELFTHNYTRLLNVIGILSENSNGKVTLGSEGIRLLSMAEAIRAFLTRPFCGIGIGSAYVYSGILSLLQTIGLIGTSILFIYYGKIIGGVKSPTVALILCAMLAPCCFTGGIDVFYSCYFLLMLLTVRTYGQNKIFVRQGEDI